MARLLSDMKHLWRQKCFAVGIPLIAVLTYITQLVRPTIGIDDTSFKIYYVDGVSPAMGRWCLYLINKIFPLNFNPHFVEAMGIIVFCISVTLWCVVFYRVFGDRLSPIVYTVAGGAMISSPILSEVVIWYLQDGIFLGYGFCALAVLLTMEAFREKGAKSWLYVLYGALTLVVALGFYEAFMIVYLMAVFMVFLMLRIVKRSDFNVHPGAWFVRILAAIPVSVLVRTAVVAGITAFFHLEDQANVLKSRGLTEVLTWFDGTKSGDDFLLMMKEFAVKYTVHGVVYLPVFILVLALGAVVCYSIYNAVRGKDIWVALACLGMLLMPPILAVLEGVATYYRSSEYVPLLTAFAVLVTADLFRGAAKHTALRTIGLFAAFVLLYNQAYEMNRWLYLESQKYENDKVVMNDVALYLQQNCDTSKPVCIIGHRKVPAAFLEDIATPAWSKKYMIVEKVVKAVDERIFDKYNTPYGYIAAETPVLSMLDWGATAFYHHDRELIKFWKMHGVTLNEDTDIDHYEEAGHLMEDAPSWPFPGSVAELDEYIIVKF